MTLEIMDTRGNAICLQAFGPISLALDAQHDLPAARSKIEGPVLCRTQLGWAEGSLVMAENLLLDYFGASPPAWMREFTRGSLRFGPTYSDFEDAPQICLSAQ